MSVRIHRRWTGVIALRAPKRLLSALSAAHLVIAVIALAVGGCSAPQIRASYTPGVSGAIVALDDARFSRARVRQGLMAPADFERTVGTGVYFVREYEPTRTPVLFIHGISGSPRDFRYLISRVNRARFQPWVFYYASGASLHQVSGRLTAALSELGSRYQMRSVVIVAHSMGGLIARDFLLQRASRELPSIALLITLSTPWEGHKGAAWGARLAPWAVSSWHDIAAGSAYLAELFGAAPDVQKTLPLHTPHHLFFSYRKSRSFGVSGDEVVSLASQLGGPAQEQASRIFGFDATHVGILNEFAVAEQLNRSLDSIVMSHQTAGAASLP